jgi:hypothetical protein
MKSDNMVVLSVLLAAGMCGWARADDDGARKLIAADRQAIAPNANWGVICPLADGSWEETALCLLPGDRLLAHMRTGEHSVVQYASADKGRTWEGPTPLTEPGQQPGGAFQLASGRLLATWGNRRPPFGAAAMLSHDGGKTWDYRHRVSLVWDMPNGDCGYANGAQAGDGTIVVVYYGKGAVSTVRFTEKQFLEAAGL